MQVTRFDPFTVLSRMDREFDELVRRGFPGPRERRGTMAGFVPAVEVVRDGGDVVVRVELPGVDVERDVAIEVDAGKLVISGERRDARQEEQGEGVLVRELRYGQFRREFALPPGVSPEQVEATYDSGLLDVRVRGVRAARADDRAGADHDPSGRRPGSGRGLVGADRLGGPGRVAAGDATEVHAGRGGSARRCRPCGAPRVADATRRRRSCPARRAGRDRRPPARRRR